ncbi:MOB kinase activator 1A [Bagarius yarrelli]|uniref:MOB kinase activator 1A n=1 Tax=Bagarius yarrelli TaxID=175774 RepID=A0A556V6M4_BAGYA|nr:MOB kinase activator 1A [Bagarius yarrelli]
MLPEGEDLNEWIAVNTVDFFNQINMLYGTITEFCTETNCSVMSAGPKCSFSKKLHLQEEAHLNTSFKHFIFFVQEFNLIDRRELVPLQELIEKLGTKDR